MVKYGKIYTFENAKEARHLIGKKVACSDIYSFPGDGTATGDLQRLNEGEDFPFTVNHGAWQFIREIEEEEKPVRMTNRQLAEWLARGFGSWKTRRSPTVYMDISYPILEENTPVSDSFHIRPWGSDEWIEPTVDIYERDCKGE